MDYKEAWESVKKTLQIGLLVNDSGLIEFEDDGAVEMAKLVIEMMENCEKLMKEEESAEEERK